MSEFTTVAKTTDILPEQGAAFPIHGRMVAVFNHAGKFFAIDDFCPHMGASLAGGHLEDETVRCPWHAWRFCIRDGTWCDNPKISIDHFELRVVGDEIQVLVPDADSRPETNQTEKT